MSAALAVATALVALPVDGAHAASLTPVVHQIILGDSYSAGNGAGDYYGPDGCYRAQRTWGQLLADELKTRGYAVDTQNWACNGAIAWDVDHEEKLTDAESIRHDPTSDEIDPRLKKRPNADDSCPAPDATKPEEDGMAPGHFVRKSFPYHSQCWYFLRPQIDHVTRATNLVTMTIGGNDLSFGKIVGRCFILDLAEVTAIGGWTGLDKTCKEYLDAALSRLRDTGSDGIEARVTRVLRAVGQRMDPQGVVEYLGYPSLIGDVRIPQSDYPDAPSVVRAGQLEFEALQKRIVDKLNAEAGAHPTYVFVPMVASFYKKELLQPGSAVAVANPDRWFVGPQDTLVKDTWYHPNPLGHAEEKLRALEALTSIPSRAPTADRRPLDLVFVIDTTSSMSPYINAVKASAINTLNALDAVSSSWRVAVVDYRDFASRTTYALDYPSRLQLDFSTDRTAITSVINQLTLGYGGDTPETMYSGLVQAINLSWRAGVDKRVLVMTDAAALDPEPITGYTAATVAQAAIALDPAEVIGVATGADATVATGLQRLIDLTGGKVTASGTGDAGAAMVAAIQGLSSDPVARLSGPYVARPGVPFALDASASIDPVGTLTSFSWDLDGDGVFDRTTTTPSLRVASAAPSRTTVTVKAVSSTGRTSTATAPVTITNRPDSGTTASGPFYTGITPVRALDTRTGVGTGSVGRLKAGEQLELPLVGRPDLPVPADADAVVLNVTVDHAAGPGFVTVWPCGTTRPLASNLNYVTDGTVPNSVLAALGRDGKVCFSSLVDVDLIADVQGYAPSLTGVSSTVPVRVLDTRSGVGAITHRVKPGETVELRIVGAAQSPVPPTAIAAVLNVTVDRASGPGFITVWPCGQPRPLASNLNYNAGSTVPNLVLAGLGVASSTCLFSSNEVDLVADVGGYVDGDAPFEARPPVRLLDTRVGTGAPHQPLAAGGVLELAVPVQLLADPVGGAVVLNVTVDQTTAPGYVTVWPCGQPRPLASNLNYGTASTVPNLVISGTGTDHKVCFYSSQSVELIADLDGAFAAPESLTGRLAPA